MSALCPVTAEGWLQLGRWGSGAGGRLSGSASHQLLDSRELLKLAHPVSVSPVVRWSHGERELEPTQCLVKGAYPESGLDCVMHSRRTDKCGFTPAAAQPFPLTPAAVSSSRTLEASGL